MALDGWLVAKAIAARITIANTLLRVCRAIRMH